MAPILKLSSPLVLILLGISMCEEQQQQEFRVPARWYKCVSQICQVCIKNLRMAIL